MAIDVVKRVPAGVKEGGQFSVKLNTESSLDLPSDVSDAEYNADGSWFFPPRPRSASQSIAFWEKAQVPDEVLRQFVDAYKERYVEYVSDRFDEERAKWKEQYIANNPEPMGLMPGAKAKWEAARKEVWVAHKDEVMQEIYRERPPGISKYDARTLARAAMMYEYAPAQSRDYDEWLGVMDHEVELYDDVYTVHQIEEEYHLSEISSSLQEIIEDTSKHDELIEEVNGLNNSLTELHDRYAQLVTSVHDSIHNEINSRYR